MHSILFLTIIYSKLLNFMVNLGSRNFIDKCAVFLSPSSHLQMRTQSFTAVDYYPTAVPLSLQLTFLSCTYHRISPSLQAPRFLRSNISLFILLSIIYLTLFEICCLLPTASQLRTLSFAQQAIILLLYYFTHVMYLSQTAIALPFELYPTHIRNIGLDSLAGILCILLGTLP